MEGYIEKIHIARILFTVVCHGYCRVKTVESRKKIRCLAGMYDEHVVDITTVKQDICQQRAQYMLVHFMQEGIRDLTSGCHACGATCGLEEKQSFSSVANIKAVI